MRIDINQRGEFVLVDDSGNELQGAKHQLESLLDEFDNLPFVGNEPWRQHDGMNCDAS
jgi:hypothetical protein